MKLLFLVILALFSSVPRGLHALNPQVDAIYQFGDSISDTGNLIREDPIGSHSAFARLPYGQNFFPKPTGRCSNGLLMIDFIGMSFIII